MRIIRVISLSLVVIFYGMPLPAYGQSSPESFSLPDCRAGEVYHVNIESVLRDKYRLRLESDSSTPLFRNFLRPRAASPQVLPAPLCDTIHVPTPTAKPGPGVFYPDARNGNLTEKGKLVTSTKRFKKDERASIVVDSKNPYLYSYNFSAAATRVEESALAAFVPFIVESLGEINPASPTPAATPVSNTGDSSAAVDDCKNAKAKVTNLL
jgi:hypothetical protein